MDTAAVRIERIPTGDYFPLPGAYPYLDVFGLHELYSSIAFKANLALVGPKGIGKSLSVANYAAKTRVPIVTFDCSEDIRRSHLLGSYVLRGDETPFVLGPLTSAFDIANDYGKCILLLEECNALSPQMQKVLNAATDFRRKIEVPEACRVFQLAANAQLWVVATMNESVYGGVYALNEDLKSRFRMLVLDYPDRAAEQKIIKDVLGDRVSKDMADKVLTLAEETRQPGALEYALSTRDVIQLLEDIQSVGLKTAIRLIRGKFDQTDHKTLDQRVTSIFGKG